MERKLIGLIKQQPMLYDVNHKWHKNISVRNAVWERIAIKMGISSKECRTKWRDLKLRITKQQQCRKWVSSIDASAEQFEPHTNSLDEERVDETTENIPNETSSTSLIPSTLKRRKIASDPLSSALHDLLETARESSRLLVTQNSSSCVCNNIDMFFISIAKEFENLTEKHKIEAKIEILNVIKEYKNKD